MRNWLPVALLVASMVTWGQAAAGKPASKPSPRGTDANRFYMEQNGKRMSARDFDAWMKSRGIRVATGKPKPVPKRRRGD